MSTEAIKKHLKLENISKKVHGREFVVNFNKTGNLAAVVLIYIRRKNKRYQFDRVQIPFCTQVLAILELTTNSLSHGFITQTLTERKLLTDYYSEKMVRSIDFLDESDELICLVFDDELLTLKITGGRLRAFYKIEINSEVVDKTFYWDFYKGAYVFGKGLSNMRDGSLRYLASLNVEYLEKDQIVEHFEKIHLNETQILNNLTDGKMSFEFQYQLMDESD